jgi:(p)ppGpp synthase/HD superfamily hydrolase
MITRKEILEHFAPLSDYGDSIKQMTEELEAAGFQNLSDRQLYDLFDKVQEADELILQYVGPAEEVA